MANHNQIPDYRRLFESAPGLFLVVLPDSPTFTVVAVSDEYLKATSKAREELLGRGLFEAGSSAESLRESLTRVLRHSVSDRVIRQPSQPWDLINTPVLADTGQILYVIHSMHDLSQRHKDTLALHDVKAMLEAQIIERTKDLTRSNLELEQFAYIASHDLQTPLRHVSSYVQLLTAKIKKTTELDPKTEKWIEYIINGTRQMKSLITDLLSYSRVGRVDVKVEHVNTENVILKISEELRETIKATRAQIVYDRLPTVVGIKSQLEQLFQNLIENALKFKLGDVDPIIHIRCEDLGEFWKFSVTDNGIGINPKYFERIFLMFHRLHSHTEFSGTGIGLAICKKIIEFHGGQMTVTSTEGHGTTFYFTLPKTEQITLMRRNNSPAAGI